eukprot:scaffold7.g3725.t1
MDDVPVGQGAADAAVPSLDATSRELLASVAEHFLRLNSQADRARRRAPQLPGLGPHPPAGSALIASRPCRSGAQGGAGPAGASKRDSSRQRSLRYACLLQAQEQQLAVLREAEERARLERQRREASERREAELQAELVRLQAAQQRRAAAVEAEAAAAAAAGARPWPAASPAAAQLREQLRAAVGSSQDDETMGAPLAVQPKPEPRAKARPPAAGVPTWQAPGGGRGRPLLDLGPPPAKLPRLSPSAAGVRRSVSPRTGALPPSSPGDSAMGAVALLRNGFHRQPADGQQQGQARPRAAHAEAGAGGGGEGVLKHVLAAKAGRLAAGSSGAVPHVLQPGQSARSWLNRQIEGYVKGLTKERQFAPFVSPVPRSEPGYYEAIKKPKCLSDIKGKAGAGKYSSPEQFKHDIKLVVDNARSFNPAAHPVHQAADVLWAWLTKQHSFYSKVDAQWRQAEVEEYGGAAEEAHEADERARARRTKRQREAELRELEAQLADEVHEGSLCAVLAEDDLYGNGYYIVRADGPVRKLSHPFSDPSIGLSFKKGEKVFSGAYYEYFPGPNGLWDPATRLYRPVLAAARRSLARPLAAGLPPLLSKAAARRHPAPQPSNTTTLSSDALLLVNFELEPAGERVSPLDGRALDTFRVTPQLHTDIVEAIKLLTSSE